MSEKDAHLQWLEVASQSSILFTYISKNRSISCLMVDGQVAGEGSSNAHTRGTLERLRRERRDLLNRMKEEVCLFFLLLVFFFSILFSTTFAQNENRMALISALDETSSLFIGTGKISTLGSLHRGESLVSDVSASLYNRVQKWSK